MVVDVKLAATSIQNRIHKTDESMASPPLPLPLVRDASPYGGDAAPSLVPVDAFADMASAHAPQKPLALRAISAPRPSRTPRRRFVE